MTNEEFVTEYQNGNEEVFDDLLSNNTGIIHFMVYKWFNKIRAGQATKEELEAECILAFYYAAKSYKPDKGATFASYAFHRIQWHLCREFKLNKPKTDTGETVTITSLDAIIPGTEDLTVGDTIADDCDLEEEVTAQVTYPKIWDAVNDLDCRSRDIIYKRYKNNMSLDSVASDFMITRERIRQIENRALKTLGKMQKVKDLAETFDYTCSTAYHYGVQRFKDTRISSVESIVFRKFELEEKMQLLEAELNNILL